MRLRDLPKNMHQTVHPFPWLFGREQQGDEYARQLLDTEVAGRFVWDGGHIVYVQPLGSWYVVAEVSRNGRQPDRALVRNEDLARRALGAQWIGTRNVEGVRELLQMPEHPVPSTSIF